MCERERFKVETAADVIALGDWDVESIGGQAILAGRRAFDRGESRPPYVWPFLRARGYSSRWQEEYNKAKGRPLS